MIKLEQLTAEEKKRLFEQMEDEKRREEEAKQEKREEYKKLVSEITLKAFRKLSEASNNLREVKRQVFEDYKTILELKDELYGIRENQQSHTFTSEDVSVTLGRRIVDNYDDTVHAGIEKVKKYISELTDGQGKEIEKILELLLRKDKNGNLKASRVLELDKIAKEVDNIDLTDGVRIIKEAYKPEKTAYFLEASYRDKETGVKKMVPLSITSIDIGDDGNDY